MLEILQFTFSSFWIWAGTVLLIIYLGKAIGWIVLSFFNALPWTFSGMERKAVWDVLEDSVLKNQLYTSREKIFKSIVLLQYNRKIRKTKLADKEIKKMMDAYFN